MFIFLNNVNLCVCEQLQNSRIMIGERDRVIGDLEEKVGFLEAEVSLSTGGNVMFQ